MGREDRILRAGFLVGGASALFFGALAYLVMHGQTLWFDGYVRNGIHRWASPLLTRIVEGVTQLGSMQILLPLGTVLAWLFYRAGRPRAALLFAITTIGSQAFDQVLKYGFRRPRPEVFFGLAQPSTYSFPSGHSVSSCCFYGVLAAILTAGTMPRARKALVWAAAAFLVLAIGFSRIYLGVHYPTDVLGGYAIAIVWVALVRAGYEVWLVRDRKLKRL